MGLSGSNSDRSLHQGLAETAKSRQEVWLGLILDVFGSHFCLQFWALHTKGSPELLKSEAQAISEPLVQCSAVVLRTGAGVSPEWAILSTAV